MRSRYSYLRLKDYNFIYRRVPRLCVDAVIRDRRGAVLSKRDIPPDGGQWHLPGGRVYLQERLADALRRICREETGLRVRIEKVIGPIEYMRLGGWGHSVSIVFLVRRIGGSLHGSRQAREISFFKSLPRNTEDEVRKFLLEHRLIRK